MIKNLYKSILVVVVCSVAFLGCNSKVKEENIALKAKVDSLETVNQKLSAGQTVLSTSIENYEKALNEIDQTLAEIASNQKEVSLLKNELKVDKTNAESIKDRISNIQEMLEISRKKIMNLDKNLNTLRKQSGAKSEEILALDNKLKQASLDLLKKETELLLMRESLEMELSEMGQDLGKQVNISNDLRNTLNRVYYFVGEAKVLQEKQIVNKEGGFIGLGKVKIVNANASSNLFQKANKETFDTIELNKRSAKMISNHPEGSYQFTGVDTVERLKIIDKEAFWKDSNYLVIEVK
ncbi:MAG: chromosome segregation ATPase [Marivirga sp.]|jgi:chromosome segregation ATPase